MKSQRTKTILIVVFGLILLANLVEGIEHAIETKMWGPILVQILILAAVGFVIYRSKDRIDTLRRQYRDRFERDHATISVKDAALFSLTWSREIYREIPEDRKKLVKQSFVLIGLAFLLLLIEFGLAYLFSLLVSLILVLAGVNLLVWVVSSERSQKETLRVELDTARSMQMRLMPTEQPEIPGYDIAGFCLPAREVGGDIYDYVREDSSRNTLGIAVADVAGKGMDAALTAVFTCGALASENRHVKHPRQLVENLNHVICTRANKSKFVSILYASLDAEKKHVTFVNAGQQKPLLFHNGIVTSVESNGQRLPAGLMPEIAYDETDLQLSRGDALLFYTDGFTEAMNPAKEPYGLERLTVSLNNNLREAEKSEKVLEGIQQDIQRFTATVEQTDDMTAVLLRVL